MHKSRYEAHDPLSTPKPNPKPQTKNLKPKTKNNSPSPKTLNRLGSAGRRAFGAPTHSLWPGAGLGFFCYCSHLGFTCIPKPYKIVGYDPLIRGSDPQNGRFLDPQVGFRAWAVYSLDFFVWLWLFALLVCFQLNALSMGIVQFGGVWGVLGSVRMKGLFSIFVVWRLSLNP